MASIPSEVYDREYFLSETCEGWEQFRADRGLSPIKTGQVAMLELRPGLRVLDAGCGRGEVLLACARAGAEVAGVDYSQAAVELTRETLAGIDGADVRRGEVTDLPWPGASFDRILFADVIEHLDPEETVPALCELRRVLRPGGVLLIHTAPNRLFVKVAWPALRPLLRVLGRGEAASQLDGWLEKAESYHANEQSVFSLRRALGEAGFRESKVWIEPNVLRDGGHFLTRDLQRAPALRFLAGIAGAPYARLLFGNDVYARAAMPVLDADPTRVVDPM